MQSKDFQDDDRIKKKKKKNLLHGVIAFMQQ